MYFRTSTEETKNFYVRYFPIATVETSMIKVF